MRAIRVGTRGSLLAKLQTDIVVKRLQLQFPEHRFEIVAVTTHGDKILDRPIADLGTRGVFVKELEMALLSNEVDFVVHSLKDLPTELPEGLLLGCVLDRSDPRDVVVSKGSVAFADLPPGSKVATSSRRRVAQLRSLRQDLTFVDMRGNIQTRLRKHDEGECDAMVLAAAGLLRLSLDDRIAEFLPVELSTPAVGQGALAIECRAGDKEISQLLTTIEDESTRRQCTAERSFLDRLGGGCSVPIGALAVSTASKNLRLTGCVAQLDGSKIIRTTLESDHNHARELGIELAEKMQALGAEEILAGLRQSKPIAISAP